MSCPPVRCGSASRGGRHPARHPRTDSRESTLLLAASPIFEPHLPRTRFMDCFPPSVLLLADAAAAADNRDVFIHVLTEAGLACCLVEVGAGSDHQALDRLGEAATERQPATILLLCSPGCGDRQAFVTRLLHVLPRATPIIVAGDGFDSDEVCALYALGIDDVVLPPFVPAAVVPRVWRLIHPVQ